MLIGSEFQRAGVIVDNCYLKNVACLVYIDSITIPLLLCHIMYVYHIGFVTISNTKTFCPVDPE